jgi:hypothetical protein
MNCISCNNILNNSTDLNRDASKYPVKLENGDIYCQGCADAYYVFNTPSKKNNNKENILPPSKSPVKSISYFPCSNSNCRKQMCGIKCESCGHPSPLYSKKKK